MAPLCSSSSAVRWACLLQYAAVFTLLALQRVAAFTEQHALVPRGHAADRNLNVPHHAYVAVCALVKNEQNNIREWIKYHSWIGIEKFYLFDHQSQPPMADPIQDYIARGLVEVFSFSDSWRLDALLFKDMYATSTRKFLSPQGWAYDNCFRWFSHRHRFIALIDPDEYIVLRDAPQRDAGLPPHLPSFLQFFEHYGGLMVHWQLFGPSGHIRRPKNATLAAYTQCVPKSAMQSMGEFMMAPLGFMKSITATRCYKAGCNPHTCELAEQCEYVNEQYQPLTTKVVKEVHWSRIAVFHYVTRSMEDYKAKMARGSGHSQFLEMNRRTGRTNRGWRYFAMVNATATGTCLEGQWAWRRCCGDLAKHPPPPPAARPKPAAAAVAGAVQAATLQ